MNRTWIYGFSVGVSLFASSSLADGTWHAWSDQTKLPAFDEHKKEVAKIKDSACKPRVRDYRTTGLAVGWEDIDSMIKKFEALLATMKPTDQGYAGVKQSLESLKKQKKKGTPLLPTGNAPGALTFQKALANIEKTLGAEASKAKVLASGDDVIASLAAKNPKVALGMLLASHRAQPKHAWTLVNASAILSMTGFLHEAVAFLDEAARLGGTLPAPAGQACRGRRWRCPTGVTPCSGWAAGGKPRPPACCSDARARSGGGAHEPVARRTPDRQT